MPLNVICRVNLLAILRIDNHSRQYAFVFGDIRDSEYRIYLDGVFETFEEGIKALYSDGEFLGD